MFLWLLANSNFPKWIKILLLVKEICSGDCEVDAWSIHWWETAWGSDNLLLAQGLLRWQRNCGIASPYWTIIEHLHRGDGEYSRSHSLRSSHHSSTTCLSSGYFKIIYPYESVWEVENVESRSLRSSSFPDPKTERLPCWDLSHVAKKNWGWAGCDGTCDYKWWELNSPLQSSYKTGKHALKASAVSSNEESLPGEIVE